jgi:hypothetical protein
MDYMQPFNTGDWIQWSTHERVKRGEIVRVAGPSLVVRWLDGEEQVFPVVEAYVGPYALGDARMVVIERPKEASRIEREIKADRMGIARAASVLGTSPKRVRAMLRGGQLQGVRKDGKWVSVDLEA